ncbi:glycosyltransferase family 8 protein [bacterium]|nr:glycosyltransferase family 8 protein [bacterium]
MILNIVDRKHLVLRAIMINICFATDENYLKYMSTAMVSILETADKNDELHFYILCNNISDNSKNNIKLLKRFKDFEVTFIDLDIEEFSKFPSGGSHISNTTYFRYKIAELCPNISKILYIDCDVIVKSSLKDLFEVDLTGYYLGGVEDVGYYYWRTVNDDFYLYKEGFYINAGVLLINLDEWRKNQLFKKLVDYTTNNSELVKIGDQDVINKVCTGKIKQLDYKWNVQDSFYREKPEREFNPNCNCIIEASQNPAIIHYTCVKKPWNDYTMSRATDWYMDYVLLLTKDENLEIEKAKIGMLRALTASLEKVNNVNKKVNNVNKMEKFTIKKFLRLMFSVVNCKKHKVLTILGIKIKFRRKNVKR